jgi:hypothetical protein
MRKNIHHEGNNRRSFLRSSLIAVAGVSAGFSILKKEVMAAQSYVRKMSVSSNAIIIPKNLQYTVKAPNHRVFKPESQQRLLKSVSPMLSQMAQEAGIKLDRTQMAKLQSAFEKRGMINVRGTSVADVTVKVGGSLSLNW